MQGSSHPGRHRRRAALALAVVLAVFTAGLVAAPSQAARPSKAAVAKAFVAAMARQDLAAAGRLVKSTTAAERKAVLKWNSVWATTRTASCVGPLCFPSPWYADPGSALLMRKANGRWWVAGLVGFPSLGPGVVVGTRALYDSTKGQRARYGPPQGTTYWKLKESVPGDAAFARVTRDGNRISIVVRLPGVIRLHAPIVACSRGKIDGSGYFRGRQATTTLPWDGYVDRMTVGSPVWRWGRTLELWGAVDWYGWGSDLQSRSWARSTASKTGGTAWTRARSACTRAG